MIADASATLGRLRQAVAKIEGIETDLAIGTARTFGVRTIDAALCGGLAPGSLHEVIPAAARDVGAATGFVLALAARAGDDTRHTLWIQSDFATLEAGDVYGPGCDRFGLPTGQLLILKVPRPLDALWTMEEALKCRGLKTVIAELPDDGPMADLTTTRRLSLAARDGGGFGFLLRQRPSPLSSSAETRWQVAAASSRPDRFGGLGRTAFTLALVKNRRGPTGQWLIAWDHHERAFSALSLGVARTAFDRPDRTSLAHAG